MGEEGYGACSAKSAIWAVVAEGIGWGSSGGGGSGEVEEFKSGSCGCAG
jgi:hypothetical protein